MTDTVSVWQTEAVEKAKQGSSGDFEAVPEQAEDTRK